MATLDIHRIRKILPHRYPFLLLDRVEDYELGEWLRAIKNVTVNEPCFQGHFPHRPVFPGVLTLEAIAQAAAVLASLSLDNQEAGTDTVYLFAGIDNARFKKPIEPGDTVVIETRIVRRLREVWKCSGQATVEGRLCASMELMFTHRFL